MSNECVQRRGGTAQAGRRGWHGWRFARRGHGVEPSEFRGRQLHVCCIRRVGPLRRIPPARRRGTPPRGTDDRHGAVSGVPMAHRRARDAGAAIASSALPVVLGPRAPMCSGSPVLPLPSPRSRGPRSFLAIAVWIATEPVHRFAERTGSKQGLRVTRSKMFVIPTVARSGLRSPARIAGHRTSHAAAPPVNRHAEGTA